MAFFTMRSCIQASLTLDTERGMSMMLLSSPMTSPIGRTVGRTCSVIGTSLTVYFSSVVTLSDLRDEAAELGGGLSGGGVEDCPCSPAPRAQAAPSTACSFSASFFGIRCIVLLGLRVCFCGF